MAVCIESTKSSNHHDEARQALRRIASFDLGHDDVQFCFDVAMRHFHVLLPNGIDTEMGGNLSLAIYNDLKLSQYIVEDDNHTTRQLRRFSLSALGRRVAANVSA
jgi:hypothetical protein